MLVAVQPPHRRVGKVVDGVDYESVYSVVDQPGDEFHDFMDEQTEDVAALTLHLWSRQPVDPDWLKEHEQVADAGSHAKLAEANARESERGVHVRPERLGRVHYRSDEIVRTDRLAQSARFGRTQT
jgi:hypothetical protein